VVTWPKFAGAISNSLEASYEELRQAIPHQKQLSSDETVIKDNRQKHWIW
jgi:hypothetical protein